MAELISALADIVGADNVLSGERLSEDYSRDEALSLEPRMPVAAVLPADSSELCKILKLASDSGVPVTARGSGTGMSGACVPRPGGLVVSFERMKRILELDLENHIAVVEAGVTLDQLNTAAAEHSLVYPVFPGENSASLGGNVATNAGGMRAVKYGVTRHHVLGLQAVLGTGEIIRTGGKCVKTSSGYDLTQLIIGSEGTLALVTEVTLKLAPRLEHKATLLAPFGTLDAAIRAVPLLVMSGVGPLMVEYIDQLTMMAITAQSGLELGIADAVRNEAQAYLLVVIEGRSSERVDEDVETAGAIAAERGALEVFVLPGTAASSLIDAREKSFWTAKRMQASEVIDVVVPRASLPAYMQNVREIATRYATMIPGCGHAGDGNVHLAVFEREPEKRSRLLRELFEAGLSLGGVISGEHGIGTEKKKYFMEFEQPEKLELMRRIKRAFDPKNVLNPGTIFD